MEDEGPIKIKITTKILQNVIKITILLNIFNSNSAKCWVALREKIYFSTMLSA